MNILIIRILIALNFLWISAFCQGAKAAWYKFYFKHPPKKELILSSSLPLHLFDTPPLSSAYWTSATAYATSTHQLRVQQGSIGVGFKAGGLYRLMLPLREFKSGNSFFEASIYKVLFKKKFFTFHKVLGIRYESALNSTKQNWQSLSLNSFNVREPLIQPLRLYYAEFLLNPRWNVGVKFNSIFYRVVSSFTKLPRNNYLEISVTRRFKI